jgi:hypothetical protein
MRLAVRLLLAWFAFFGLSVGLWQSSSRRPSTPTFPGGGITG